MTDISAECKNSESPFESLDNVLTRSPTVLTRLTTTRLSLTLELA